MIYLYKTERMKTFKAVFVTKKEIEIQADNYKSACIKAQIMEDELSLSDKNIRLGTVLTENELHIFSKFKIC